MRFFTLANGNRKYFWSFMSSKIIPSNPFGCFFTWPQGFLSCSVIGLANSSHVGPSELPVWGDHWAILGFPFIVLHLGNLSGIRQCNCSGHVVYFLPLRDRHPSLPGYQCLEHLLFSPQILVVSGKTIHLLPFISSHLESKVPTVNF